MVFKPPGLGIEVLLGAADRLWALPADYRPRSRVRRGGAAANPEEAG